MKVTDEMKTAIGKAVYGQLNDDEREAAATVVLAIVERDFVPTRDDAVAAWIKRSRDQYERNEHVYTNDMRWDALDDLLEDYREHADTGVPLAQEVAGPYSHLEPVESAPYSPGGEA